MNESGFCKHDLMFIYVPHVDVIKFLYWVVSNNSYSYALLQTFIHILLSVGFTLRLYLNSWKIESVLPYYCIGCDIHFVRHR